MWLVRLQPLTFTAVYNDAEVTRGDSGGASYRCLVRMPRIAVCYGDGIDYLAEQKAIVTVIVTFSKQQHNTIQLYCLCVEKFAFWFVIYIFF